MRGTVRQRAADRPDWSRPLERRIEGALCLWNLPIFESDSGTDDAPPRDGGPGPTQPRPVMPRRLTSELQRSLWRFAPAFGKFLVKGEARSCGPRRVNT